MIEVNKVYCGKMENVLKEFPDNYCDSIVTDSPYGLKFMNKHWDYDVPSIGQWKEAFRVLKPGGYLLSFGGTRTYHRMVVNIEDAGFEIRDQIQWLYGSGFPKSLDISKAIDKQKGTYVEGEISANSRNGVKGEEYGYDHSKKITLSNPQSDQSKQWEGWGTALKPANEPICVARKPISENTVAENVLKWGTGGINIDGCRIETDEEITNHSRGKESSISKGKYGDSEAQETHQTNGQQLGRFPANIILDEFMAKELDKQSGILTSGNVSPEGYVGEYTGNIFGKFKQNQIPAGSLYGDTGGASRFFYVAKPSQYERSKGCNKMQARKVNDGREVEADNAFQRGKTERTNFHPTVKPIDLMKYLVKLVTQKGGICLDPFAGSGTTGIGCKLELINYILIDMEIENCELSEARIAAWNPPKYKEQTLFPYNQ